MAQIARAAVGAGIAWGIINSTVDYIPTLRQHVRPRFPAVCDHEAIGNIQGDQMGAILGDKGCVLYIEGPSVRDVAKIRSKGMISTSNGRRVEVKTLKGDWTQGSAYNAIRLGCR